ncbi:MAG TPA: MaoC family dehydratase N-terminal domain-containing protein [Acidimicrobiales bacterium]|nr:MaoC family dehydratase N-terminal domain-containing protein [Acidimicrobiales bacterium]
MPIDTSVIGKVSARRVVAVERAPVSVFAKAVKDPSRIYQDPREAESAGFDSIPAPPTFPFAMPYWGEHPELQEGIEPVGSNPLWKVMGSLGPGLILHGEQEFEYSRPVMVGDVLEAEDVLSDVYQRETDTHVMTFMVTETEWKVRGTGEHVVTARFNLVHRARKQPGA